MLELMSARLINTRPAGGGIRVDLAENQLNDVGRGRPRRPTAAIPDVHPPARVDVVFVQSRRQVFVSGIADEFGCHDVSPG
jgi:hypothetical protein